MEDVLGSIMYRLDALVTVNDARADLVRGVSALASDRRIAIPISVVNDLAQTDMATNDIFNELVLSARSACASSTCDVVARVAERLRVLMERIEWHSDLVGMLMLMLDVTPAAAAEAFEQLLAIDLENDKVVRGHLELAREDVRSASIQAPVPV